MSKLENWVSVASAGFLLAAVGFFVVEHLTFVNVLFSVITVGPPP